MDVYDQNDCPRNKLIIDETSGCLLLCQTDMIYLIFIFIINKKWIIDKTSKNSNIHVFIFSMFPLPHF